MTVCRVGSERITVTSISEVQGNLQRFRIRIGRETPAMDQRTGAPETVLVQLLDPLPAGQALAGGSAPFRAEPPGRRTTIKPPTAPDRTDRSVATAVRRGGVL